jgi:hypothetical protein
VHHAAAEQTFRAPVEQPNHDMSGAVARRRIKQQAVAYRMVTVHDFGRSGLDDG